MASPVTGEPNLPIIDLNLPSPVEDDAHPHIPEASSLGKRRKRKPKRYEGSETDVQMERPNPKALSDPSSSLLSLRKEKSPTKGLKTPAPTSPAMIRALELRNSLGNDLHTCIKIMSHSQVTTGFWMGLPVKFCEKYLPKEDASFVLEDENGGHYDAKYISKKYGLSAGWKHFARQHALTEEDILVFQLVEPTKFKVYIFKANDSNEANHALSLLNLEERTEHATPVNYPSHKTNKNKHPESLSATVSQKKHKKSVPSSISDPPSSHRIEHSGNNSKDGSPKALGYPIPSKPYLFQDVKSFQDFHIMVKGVCIDHELHVDIRTGYYKLCAYKKEFLHDSVSEGLYEKLVPGMIGQIVSVVNEIKRCKVTATKQDFDTWDKSLTSFELLGMKVGFIRDKIHRLAELVFESEGAADIKRYVEARNEGKHAEEEIKKVEAKLQELKERAKTFDGIAGGLKSNVEKYEREFEEEVDGI